MADASDRALKKTTDTRVTVRLSEHELRALRALAETCEEDLTSVIRAAIAAYLDHEQMAVQLLGGVKREADRVIERHEQTTRALIAALNDHLLGSKKP